MATNSKARFAASSTGRRKSMARPFDQPSHMALNVRYILVRTKPVPYLNQIR